ncbi:2OG-Fe(II) oxygenase [Sulfobacillus thermotolerans]|uniref:2OG-Fe(II) oxygenase n=1 Tax=Sulfobacillus thermotolerans TaxID=338644 RepID=A0ABM6RWD3_9FIRM|nr:2OG-Fe(II) oxygenase [Sulfobacillus thermotolerans]
MQGNVKTRDAIATLILERLRAEQSQLIDQYQSSKPISTFIIDNLLPEDLAHDIFSAFPDPNTLVLRSSLKERKYVGVQMNAYHPLVAEALYAFQDLRVVSAIQSITNIPTLLPDKHLYAGGISMMGQGHYLLPHLDNSHDMNRQNYRVLNLLYYVSKDWKEEYGGNLELWPNGPKQPQRTIFSRFNRLAVMVTHKQSWHSVSEVKYPGVRCCVSNYYFSPLPVDGQRDFHVTTFRAFPGHPLQDAVLIGDNAIRTGIRKIVKKQSTFQKYEDTPNLDHETHA